MKYIICTMALLLTACFHTMTAKEVEARQQFCYNNKAKATKLLTDERTKSVYNVRCVFDGYETDSEYSENK